jgi:hypothetical protein
MHSKFQSLISKQASLPVSAIRKNMLVPGSTTFWPPGRVIPPELNLMQVKLYTVVVETGRRTEEDEWLLTQTRDKWSRVRKETEAEYIFVNHVDAVGFKLRFG